MVFDQASKHDDRPQHTGHHGESITSRGSINASAGLTVTEYCGELQAAVVKWQQRNPMDDTPLIRDSLALSNMFQSTPNGCEVNVSEDPDAFLSGTQLTFPSPVLRSASLPKQLPAPQSTDPQLFYMDLWNSECIPTLPSAFLQLGSPGSLPPMIINTMLALSASQLSRSVFKSRHPETSQVVGPRQPILLHQNFAYQFYGSAMQSLSRWQDSHSETSASLALAVMVLFCCLESVMGDFKAFSLHAMGVERLIESFHQTTIMSPGSSLENELLMAWDQARLHNWWLRIHFSTPEIHLQHPPPLMHPALALKLEGGHHSRAMILRILCESYHMQLWALARCWQHVSLEDATSSTDTAWREINASEQDTLPCNVSLYDIVSQTLLENRRQLDDWHSRLESAERPLFESQETQAFGSSFKRFRPLLFCTHTAAVNYAYYAAARVMACTGTLKRLLRIGEEHDADACDEGYWISMLLRVISGMSWADCLHLNVHTIGLSGLLLACILRSNDPTLGEWVEHWLQCQDMYGATEEGSFPVQQIHQALHAVNVERRHGRDVLALYQPADDGGGESKYGSYTSQTITALVLFGRCGSTGLLYSKTQNV